MKWFVMVLVALPLTEAAESDARELWQQQMKKLDGLIDEYHMEQDVKAQTKQIGLPFFGIGFESELEKRETTVHTLRPQDIDIVAAMGDSLSAANGAGADTIAGLIFEYRGMCFSVGGDNEVEDSITIPNILKKFNNRIDGFSNGVSIPLPIPQAKHGFNVAVPGARADDMLKQAKDLIQRLKDDERSNFEEDWKLLTLFIGGNDLCAIGRDPEGTTPEVYVEEIKKGLDLLHSEVPRMFVNLVDILDIYLLPYVGEGYGSTRVCRIMQRIFCDHVVRTMNNKTAQDELRAINKQYQIQLQALIDTGIYDTRDDFTVVVQPFLRDSTLPYTEFGEVDATYFAPDCFHFSDIGHAMGAINLWNNMLEPVGQKTTVWSITDLKVPTKERPYFFTNKNSQNLPPLTTEPGSQTVASPTSSTAEVWVIVVMSILTFLLVAETIFLVFCSANGPEQTNVAKVDFAGDIDRKPTCYANSIVSEEGSQL